MAEKKIYHYDNGATLIYYQQNLNKSTNFTIGFKLPSDDVPNEDEAIYRYKNVIFYVNDFNKNEIRVPLIKPGLKHFLEHMFFHSSNEFERKEIYEYFRKSNTIYNAYTTQNCVVVECDCPTKYLKENMDIHSKMLLRKEFPEKDIEEEKKVVLQELNRTLDEYYDAIRKHDNNRILEFLGATTLEEKRDLLRMIYAINSMNYRTSYLRNLTNKSSDYDDNDIYKMTDNIKYLYYITIMKYSLRSLINYNLESIDYSLELDGLNDNVLLSGKNSKNNVRFDDFRKDTDTVLGRNNGLAKDNKLSLEENVFLYYLVVSNLVNDSYMETNEVRSYYASFLDEYASIKKSYFKILSSIYKVDVGTIETMFLSYNDSEVNFELGCYYGNMIGDEEFSDMLWEHQDLIKGVLEKFPKLKYTAFLKYREIKEGRYLENDSVEVIEDVINSKNTYANYTVRTGK